ncbi:MAG: hypothetical protein SFY80_11915 [Verrucomicrobiota bacterium]|nr:hypothetical protein [Verrucomicrobiota bacterium]
MPTNERLIRNITRGLLFLTAIVTASVASAGNLYWQTATPLTASGPQRTFHDGEGALYAYFQPVDIVNGSFAGAPIRLLESNGNLNESFNLRGYLDSVSTMARQSTGNVIVAGVRAGVATVVRALPSGEIDSTFTLSAYDRNIRFITVQPDNKILVAVVDVRLSIPPSDLIRVVPNPLLLRLNADGTVDSSFTPVELMDAGAILFVPPVLDAAGNIYIGGYFNTIGGQPRQNFARLTPSGTLDTSYMASASISQPFYSNQVRGIGLQPDGSAVLVGDFYVGAGVSNNVRFGSIRFNPQGNFDASYPRLKLYSDLGIRVGVRPRAMVMNPDGSYYAVSDRIWRFLANGTLDTTWPTPVFDQEAFWLSMGSNGHIYVPGVSSVSGQPVGGIAAIKTDGTLNSAFNPGGFGVARFPSSAVLLGDGRVAIAGAFNRYGSEQIRFFTYLEADGNLSPNQFHVEEVLPEAELINYGAITPGPNGSIYGLVNYTTPTGTKGSGIGRINANAVLDDSFEVANEETLLKSYNTIASSPDGSLYLVYSGGAQSVVDGLSSPVIRLMQTGDQDTTFVLAQNLSSKIGYVTRNANNDIDRIEVGGIHIAQITANGRLYAILNQTDGECRLLRLLPTGEIDAGFNPPGIGTSIPSQSFPTVFDPVKSQSVQPLSGAFFYNSTAITDAREAPEGTVYVSGNFSQVNGHSTNGIVRLFANGSVDTSFSMPADPAVTPSPFVRNTTVQSLAIDDYGRIYAAGNFTTYGNRETSGIIRLKASGAIDTEYSPNIKVFAYNDAPVKLQTRGDILYAFGAVGKKSDLLPGGFQFDSLNEVPITETSSTTYDLGNGFKYNFNLGYIYDGFYPFLYLYDRGGWIYVVGKNEAGYYFFHFGREHWGYAGVGFYPYYVVLGGPQDGAVLSLDPAP